MAIPLVLLPIVCSALSEVNFEGDRVVSDCHVMMQVERVGQIIQSKNQSWPTSIIMASFDTVRLYSYYGFSIQTRRLCPTSERLDLLLYIRKNPLHLTIYGQTIRFGNMSNGLIGLATALFTGIAINKFMKSVH